MGLTSEVWDNSAMRGEGRSGGTGERLMGMASVLATVSMGDVGISGMGSESVQVGDGGVDGAW